MKIQAFFPVVSVICLATLIGCIAPGTSSPSVTPSENRSGRIVAQSNGQFKSVEHPTEGTVRVSVDGKKRRFLVLQPNFKTDPGPDLFVILHRSAQAPKDYSPKNYVILGRLQKGRGTQQYAIPSSLKLAEYKSVVIWCRQFNATFGYAPL
jgi:hypothetical protein